MNTKLPINEASRILGVSLDTVRRWEKRGLIHSERTPGGHRRYDISEVDYAKNKKRIRIPETLLIKIIGNPTKPAKPGIISRLICFVVVSYSLIFIAQNPVVLADAIKGIGSHPSVLGVSSTGGSNVTLASVLDSNFNLAIKGILNAGGISGVTYNAFANSGQFPVKTSVISTSNDLFIGGDLEVAGTINPTGFLAGSIPFINSSGALAQDNTNLFYNDTSKRVGIGTLSPASSLGVLGNTAIGATYGALAAPTSGLLVEGKVGIGTTNPTYKLDVSSGNSADTLQVISTATSGQARINISGGAGGLGQIDNSVGDFYLTNGASTGNLIFRTNNNEYMRLTSSGNVGIGTGSPGYKLDISSANSADTLRVTSTATSGQARINITGGTGGLGQIDNSVGDFFLTNSASTGNLIFRTNSTEYMRINSSGNVGIGTTSPVGKLDVRGTGYFGSTALSGIPGQVVIQDPTATAGNSLSITTNGNIGSSVLGINFIDRINGTSQGAEGQTGAYIQSQRSGSSATFGLAFGTSNGVDISADATTKVVIDGNGKLGIGNISPVGLLDVSGAVTGKALAILNETGNQALFTASASGVAKFTIQHNGLTDASANGVATNVSAGVISDSTYGSDTPVNGLMGVDSADGRFYFRYGGAWHYVAQSAGFQIPNYETFAYDFDTKSFDTTKPLADGDFLIPFAEKRLSDGAVHGLYTRIKDVADKIFKDVQLVVNSLLTNKIVIANTADTTKSTIGVGKVLSGTKEINISNENINDKSLIYVTPTTSTNNHTIYIKAQSNGSFTVGFDDISDKDVSFNWWIVETQK